MTREEISLLMLDMLSKHVSIQEIVDRSTEIIGNPIVLIDNRFRILYSSKNVKIDIELWKESLVEGYILDEVLESMVKEKVFSRLKNVTEPIKTLLPNGYQALRMPLFYNKTYCGFVGVTDYIKEITQEDEETLVIISKAISSLLDKDNDFVNFDENAYETFLYQLVQATTKEKADVVCRKNAPLCFGSNKVILCIAECGDSENQKLPACRFRDVLKSEFPNSFSTVIDEKIILLINKNKLNLEGFHQTIRNINQLCIKYGFTVGMSFDFLEDSFVHYAYLQALSSIKTEKGNQSVHTFEDRMMQNIASLCNVHYPKQFYLHPIIKILEKYDEEYHTEYLDTLFCYLKNLGNLKETAEQLNIHYNTMKYRISNMEDIVDRDLRNDKRLVILLYVSMLIFGR